MKGTDYFGHIPASEEKRGYFSVFYDMTPDVSISRGCVVEGVYKVMGRRGVLGGLRGIIIYHHQIETRGLLSFMM